MRQKRWCGLTTRMGTVLSGVFSIMATHMHLIFERKHLGDVNCTDYNHSHSVNVASNFIICWNFEIVIVLSVITLVVSSFFLYCVFAQIYRGLIGYVVWIVSYESANLGVQILTHEFKMAWVRAMRWFGWVFRTSLHCFWIFFVIAHAQVIYNSQKRGNILSYHPHISMATRDTPRRKAKILSFIHHYGDE
ncbi:transmembrane protein 217 [Nannospalax galili]|uniref:transmembrane protein 217 n=1 Tax=Nannospalax galili TaxID=1026970 RepID=UPI0004ED33E8|nr:transmembrane protein 217 [Nannospalax galili]